MPERPILFSHLYKIDHHIIRAATHHVYESTHQTVIELFLQLNRAPLIQKYLNN